MTGLSEENNNEVADCPGNVSIQVLLRAGLIIGSLGVLNDVTITQASAAFEIARSTVGGIALALAVPLTTALLGSLRSCPVGNLAARQEIQQILAVARLEQRLRPLLEFVVGDEPHPPGNLLRAGHLETLASLDGADEIACLQICTAST